MCLFKGHTNLNQRELEPVQGSLTHSNWHKSQELDYQAIYPCNHATGNNHNACNPLAQELEGVTLNKIRNNSKIKNINKKKFYIDR